MCPCPRPSCAVPIRGHAIASAGNRTRVTSMATMYSTTRPLMLLHVFWHALVFTKPLLRLTCLPCTHAVRKKKAGDSGCQGKALARQHAFARSRRCCSSLAERMHLDTPQAVQRYETIGVPAETQPLYNARCDGHARRKTHGNVQAADQGLVLQH